MNATYDDTPVDLAAVQADDALLDLLGGPVVITDDELSRVLYAWRREVDTEPIGELVDAETALAEIGVGRRTVSRSWRRSWRGPVTAALAVLVLAVSVAGLVAKEAHPGDLLWPAHELLYPDGR